MASNLNANRYLRIKTVQVLIQIHNTGCCCILAIYAPKISTAPYVMVFLGADAFTRANVKGWESEIENIFGPVKWQRAVRRVPFRVEYIRDFRLPPLHICPSKASAPMKTITYSAVEIFGA